MIGRFTRTDRLAQVGFLKPAQVVLAGTLILAAAVSKYLTHAPDGIVIALVIGSLCFTGFPVIWGAVRGLIRFETNVDELVSIAIVACMVLGEWITAGIVAWIMSLGSLIEEYTSQRARRHIEALTASGPRGALLIGEDGHVTQIALDALRPGQRILARPGDVIAADGVIEQGESELDESMITGESVPSQKTSGDRVFAGAINGGGSLTVRVQRVGEESTQGKIARLVLDAERHRAPVLRAAEAYARWFTPAILLLATGVFLVTGEALRAVTVLIVGCPCAFVLATPTAIVAALGRASKRGILIKGGVFLEACARVKALAFDKTGTLTTGNCRVRDVVPSDGRTPEELLHRAASLEAGAEHPLARAVVDKAREAGLEVAGVSIQREAGLGVSQLAAADGSTWHVGNRRFAERKGVVLDPPALDRVQRLQADGHSLLFVSEGAELRGLMTIEDEIRPEAASTLAVLAAAGHDEIYVLTGDASSVARRTGGRLGLPEAHIRAEMLPEDKLRFIQSLESEGRRVCYVGDGANDGPALAAASVGVSIGARENTVALETADVVLMRDGLAGLPFLLHLGKATTRTINQNLILFGLLFNAAMLCLSGLGLLSPILGAIGHNAGSVAVVLNSARLLRLGDESRAGYSST